MAQFKSLKQVLLAKIETTYGVDATPTGAANALLVGNLNINPIVAASVDRKVIRPYFGGDGKIITERHAEITFDVELSASGVAGTAPGWGVLLKGCAMAETLTAGVSVVYSPISALEQSLTFYANIDGLMYKIIGARGTVTGKLTAKGDPQLSFKFLGLYASPTDTALPTPVLTAFKTPLAVNAQNTSATLFGYAAPVADFSFDLGNATTYRSLINAELVVFTDRTAVGSITLEQPAMAQKDFFAAVTNQTLVALTLTHGTVAGQKVKIDAPRVQLTDVQISNLDGVQMLQMPLSFTPSVGNDELTITCL